MSNNAQRKMLLTRYLLGQVSVEQRADLEERYLRDDGLFEELVTAENDMIDAYVAGKLSVSEQRQFEAYFLSTPERRERAHFAKSLMNYGAPGVSAPGTAKAGSNWLVIRALLRTSPPGLRLALAAVLLIAVAGFSWMAVVNWKLHRQLKAIVAGQADAQRQAQELRRRVADLEKAGAAGQDAEIENLPAPGSAILSVTLAPRIVRGGGQQQSTLHLSPGISQVHLLLRYDHDEYSTFDAVLENVEGREVWRSSRLQGRLAPNGSKVIVVQVSANALQQADYVLKLLRPTSGGSATEVGIFTFRVVK